MNHHYGQAPNAGQGFPFVYQPPSVRPAVPTGLKPLSHPGQQPYHFTPGWTPQSQNLPQPTRPVTLPYQIAAPSSALDPQFKPASHVYPSYQAQAPPPQPTHFGGQYSAPQTGFRGKGYGGFGGKGKGKGGYSGSQQAGQGPLTGKAANAIPLGKQRVFASSEESTPEEEAKIPERPVPHRPMQVVGRGRALTAPAWATELKKSAPGATQSDERSRVHDIREEPRNSYGDKHASARSDNCDNSRYDAQRSYDYQKPEEKVYRQAVEKPIPQAVPPRSRSPMAKPVESSRPREDYIDRHARRRSPSNDYRRPERDSSRSKAVSVRSHQIERSEPHNVARNDGGAYTRRDRSRSKDVSVRSYRNPERSRDDRRDRSRSVRSSHRHRERSRERRRSRSRDRRRSPPKRRVSPPAGMRSFKWD